MKIIVDRKHLRSIELQQKKTKLLMDAALKVHDIDVRELAKKLKIRINSEAYRTLDDHILNDCPWMIILK